MRLALCLVALCAGIAGAQGALAQTGPVIVIPGKAGVPVTINGVIVDGAVVYGDWGLARPGHGEIVIEGPVGFAANWDQRGYFPATGHQPRYGRLEIEPPPPRVRANTTYNRTWSIESDFRRPVTEYPPFNPPPVILAPRQELPGRQHR
jgi:hypothetical protein